MDVDRHELIGANELLGGDHTVGGEPTTAEVLVVPGSQGLWGCYRGSEGRPSAPTLGMGGCRKQGAEGTTARQVGP